MKNTTFSILFLAAVLSFSFSAKAATEDWTFDSLSNIFQIVSDGKGGCAMIHNTNSLVSPKLVWLDKSGQEIYQTTLSNIQVSTIMQCTPKQLLFSDHRSTPVFIQVDDQGVETIVPSSAGKYNMLPGLEVIPVPTINNKLDDKKGFFLVRSSTNGNATKLIRYKNK